MSKFDGYHTALERQSVYHKLRNRIEFDDGVAFRYDLFSEEFPEVYRRCDVIYSDLPWRSGFLEFEARANVKARPYAAFLKQVRAHIDHYGLPTVMVTGKHAVPYLEPDRVYDTRLNGSVASALCWGVELSETGSERDILSELSERFSCAGDWCCGYGRTGAMFRAVKKRFVMSDFNGSCIGYIEDHF